jgi:S-adenosylmethionine:tRNA ribosyltransferase-isomerase
MIDLMNTIKTMGTVNTMDTFDFLLPAELEATEPPEARGLARDEVRLMVSHYTDRYVRGTYDRVEHTHFRAIGNYLSEGDLLVINTSGTMNAALNAIRADGTKLELHLSTHLPADMWIVEVRIQKGKSTMPFMNMHAGETLRLPGNAEVTLHAPYQRSDGSTSRLWIATLHLPCEPAKLVTYLEQYGFPIRYSYVKEGWPNSYYQTVYATEMGSAEMPSAGRAFTADLITQLVARGIHIAPLLLHTGVASLESHEPPYEEFYRVSSETARMVNAAHSAGKRVVAVGTTVVRALETVTDNDGVTHPGEGWTRLVITPERGMRAANAMLTGLHEPKATHLAMLEALVSRSHLTIAYHEALRERYLWHEFGDLHLLVP